MTLPVAWLPEAASELTEARAYYDQIRPDLGERFALAVDTTISAIAKNPLQYAVGHKGIRRAGVRRFPHGVFFEVQDIRILILACFHSSRDPRHWQTRRL